ncbi:hypothetical protein psyc5s11_23090 [Clostridium gelidum]|uniref:Uncharacterized protein n=1 Tax=Clostridium gelidum TaxID=704125 RepID=A0ABM7T2T3_9CLOT|nr:hypothetical protein [Clostridium gelidum]BCZ46242.1 hypothetical protein psyc5s11_23090 [Clostridium gelidum]
MRNNERFIQQWSKKRGNGRLKYIIINSTIYCIVYWIFASLIFLIQGKEFHKLIENFDLFIIFIVIYIISLFIKWKKNEDKYSNIINNK